MFSSSSKVNVTSMEKVSKTMQFHKRQLRDYLYLLRVKRTANFLQTLECFCLRRICFFNPSVLVNCRPRPKTTVCLAHSLTLTLRKDAKREGEGTRRYATSSSSKRYLDSKHSMRRNTPSDWNPNWTKVRQVISCNKAKSGVGEIQKPSCSQIAEWTSPREVNEWKIWDMIRYSWTSNTRNTKSRDPLQAVGRNCGARIWVTVCVRSCKVHKIWRIGGGRGGNPKLDSHKNASEGVLFMIRRGNFLLSWCWVAIA